MVPPCSNNLATCLDMALILHYFIEFVYDVVVKQLLVLPRFQNILLIVYDHINTICRLI